jgi:tRNA nucleotidyltransferase/poly(A) polymerase
MSDVRRKISLAWTDEVLDLQESLAHLGTPVFIVGGAVRDAFMRRPIRDLDLATPQSGMKLARQIANRLHAAYYALDEERDVGRVVMATAEGHFTIDVARFRGETLEQDLLDRDFSINAMAVDIHGDLAEIFDPCHGIEALQGKTLHQCHENSLASDPVRVLRGVRYSVEFGLRIAPDTVAAMRTSADRLKQVSQERQRDELFKLLEVAKPHTSLMIADSVGILRMVLPDLAGQQQNEKSLSFRLVEMLQRVWQAYSPYRTDETTAQFALGMFVIALDRFRSGLSGHFEKVWADERPHRVLLFLAALLRHLSEELIEQYSLTLRLSNAEKDRWIALHRAYRLYGSIEVSNPVAIFRYWQKHGAGGIDAIILALTERMTREGTSIHQNEWLGELERAQVLLSAYFDEPSRFVSPPLLVTGDDLMAALQLKPGKIIGELLSRIQEAQVRGDVQTVEDALALARNILNLSKIQSNGHHTG